MNEIENTSPAFENPELVTIGHILLDIRGYVDEFPKPDSSVKIKGDIHYSPGGSATNVAVGAGRLGIQSTICSIIGFDDYGLQIIQHLMKEHIDISNIKINYHKPSGISMLVINKEGSPIIIQSLGANEPFPIAQLDRNQIIQAKHLHMTGTDPLILKEAAHVAKHNAKGNVRVSFDPGRSISHMGYEKLMDILENIDYLIINRKEAAHLRGISEDTATLEVIKELRAVLPETITLIIKGGSKETIVKSTTEFFAVPPYNVTVFDTIGAGDAFAAGFISGLLRNASLKRAIILAHATAGYKVQFGGAQSSPTSAQLEEFLQEHKDEVAARDL
ncbi:MAG: carbohydrate kinase family protein [Promethearchaeota archaeon]|nr:MAG: carbohydrate kinase family protein [Candidatus Lokiarchaeota archaeon]